ncbi:uncharacterized mitochondrial protein-like protein [Tanacetum coccineum]
MFSLGNNATPEASNDDQFGDATELDMSNLNVSYQVPITPHTRINKDHSLEQVIGDIQSRVQTKRMANKERFLSEVYKGKSHEDLNTCLFACFLSQEEPKRITKALSDLAWVEAVQEELLQFKLSSGTRRMREIEAIRLFLAYASFMGFMVNQIDVKSAFLYGQINEEIYVDDIIFGSTNKELCIAFEKLMKDKFQMSSMGELTFFLGLQVQQKQDGIFISQDKYVADILRKFNYTDVKTASTPVDLEKPLVKDGNADDVDVHLYKSMIGSLMYLTTSRPDIMFVVCACARFQVTPKTSHLLAVKIIFRCLKGKSSLGLWYSRDSPFELVAYTDSDYARDTQDRKSTTGGYLFTKGFDAGRSMIEFGDTNYDAMLEGRFIMESHDTSNKSVKEIDKLKEVGTLRDVDAQTRFEATSKLSNDPPLLRGYTLGIGEDSLKLLELMAHCTKLCEYIIEQLFIHQMAHLEFCDKHNMVAYLLKSEGSKGFHDIIDFLSTAALSTTEDGVQAITATIDESYKGIL